jgi:hypothetical protein
LSIQIKAKLSKTNQRVNACGGRGFADNQMQFRTSKIQSQTKIRANSTHADTLDTRDSMPSDAILRRSALIEELGRR